MGIIITPLRQPNNLSSPLPSKVTFTEDKETIVIGREITCDITLECQDKIISRKHAQIAKKRDGYELTDLSANGTFTSNSASPIGLKKSVKLTNNTIVNIGDFQLKFEQTATKPKGHELFIAGAPANIPVVKKAPKKVSKDQLTARKSLPEANITQAFIPPSVVIPEDWNASFDAKKESARRSTPKQINQLIDNNDGQLLASLLKGLGLNDKKSRQALNSENMVAIGRCLRTAISGTIKQIEHVESIKAKLCLDEKNSLNAHNYSSFGDISSIEEFLDELLSNRQQSYSHLPLEIARCQKEVTEDYAIILTSYNKAIDSFREELSPFSVESEFQSQGAGDTTLSAKLVPAIGKWHLYKTLWSKKCLNFKNIIKKNFEESVKQVHIKRINQRQINRKK